MWSGLLDLTAIVREGQIKFLSQSKFSFWLPASFSSIRADFGPCTAKPEHTAMSAGAEEGHEKRRERDGSRTRRAGRETQM